MMTIQNALTKDLTMSEEQVSDAIIVLNAQTEESRPLLHKIASTESYKRLGCNSLRDLVRKYLMMDLSTVYREVNAAKVELVIGEPVGSISASVLVPLFKLKKTPHLQKKVWHFGKKKLKELRPNQKSLTAKQLVKVINHLKVGQPTKKRLPSPEAVAKKIADNIPLLSNCDACETVFQALKEQLNKIRDQS